MKYLSDLGERKIIDEILTPRYKSKGVEYYGNDCALITDFNKDIANEDSIIVGTTDPCPEPMSSILGFEDFYYRGWLLATINLSDLAAAGVKPLGLLTSYNLPNDLLIEDFYRLLDGVDDCCSLCETTVVGGNLKESPSIQLSATAFGIGRKSCLLSREGGKRGDNILLIGDLGLFWAGVLSNQKGVELSDEQEAEVYKNILKPIPKINIANELATSSLLNSCIDNSDGLYPSLLQLSGSCSKKAIINFENVSFPPVVLEISEKLKLDPVRLALGWGDWQLIGSANPKDSDKIYNLGEKHGIPIHIIGRLEDGHGVYLEHQNQIGELMKLDSERFSKDSWFTTGIEAYIETLLSEPLLKV